MGYFTQGQQDYVQIRADRFIKQSKRFDLKDAVESVVQNF